MMIKVGAQSSCFTIGHINKNDLSIRDITKVAKVIAWQELSLSWVHLNFCWAHNSHSGYSCVLYLMR